VSKPNFIVLTNQIERGGRLPTGEREYLYKRGDKFPTSTDDPTELDIHKLLAKNAILDASKFPKGVLDAKDRFQQLVNLHRNKELIRKGLRQEEREKGLEELKEVGTPEEKNTIRASVKKA